MTESDRARHRRAQDLLIEALDLPVDRRDDFLRERVPEDAELRKEVRSLLEALDRESVVDAVVDDTSDHLVHDSNAPQGGLGDTPGSDAETLGVVGSFQLRRLLGQGGMGSVYLADRIGEDYKQQVALKLVRAGYFDAKISSPPTSW